MSTTPQIPTLSSLMQARGPKKQKPTQDAAWMALQELHAEMRQIPGYPGAGQSQMDKRLQAQLGALAAFFAPAAPKKVKADKEGNVDAFAWVAQAVSRDNTRYAIASVFVQLVNGCPMLCATDGHRAHIAPVPAGMDGMFKVGAKYCPRTRAEQEVEDGQVFPPIWDVIKGAQGGAAMMELSKFPMVMMKRSKYDARGAAKHAYLTDDIIKKANPNPNSYERETRAAFNTDFVDQAGPGLTWTKKEGSKPAIGVSLDGREAIIMPMSYDTAQTA